MQWLFGVGTATHVQLTTKRPSRQPPPPATYHIILALYPVLYLFLDVSRTLRRMLVRVYIAEETRHHPLCGITDAPGYQQSAGLDCSPRTTRASCPCNSTEVYCKHDLFLVFVVVV